MPPGHISAAPVMGREKSAFPEASAGAVFRVLPIDMK